VTGGLFHHKVYTPPLYKGSKQNTSHGEACADRSHSSPIPLCATDIAILPFDFWKVTDGFLQNDGTSGVNIAITLWSKRNYACNIS